MKFQMASNGFKCHFRTNFRETEAVAQRCSVKKVFLKFRKIHRKTPVPVSFLIKLQVSKNIFC